MGPGMVSRPPDACLAGARVRWQCPTNPCPDDRQESGAPDDRPMDPTRIGALVRALRHRQQLRQDDLARRAGCSQSAISRFELGQFDGISLAAIDRVVRSLDAYLEVRILWHGAQADRILDADHARVVEAMIRRLERAGWRALPEVTFNVYGERGSVDILADHPALRSRLVVEVKTAIGDVQATIAAHDRKVRLAHRSGAFGGSVAAGADRLLVVAGTRTARRHVDAHAATFRAAYPDRDPDVARWLRRPGPRARPLAGLIFVTPTREAGDIHLQRVRTGRNQPTSRSKGEVPDGRATAPRPYHPPGE